jgi:hypothetical protein
MYKLHSGVVPERYRAGVVSDLQSRNILAHWADDLHLMRSREIQQQHWLGKCFPMLQSYIVSVNDTSVFVDVLHAVRLGHLPAQDRTDELLELRCRVLLQLQLQCLLSMCCWKIRRGYCKHCAELDVLMLSHTAGAGPTLRGSTYDTQCFNCSKGEYNPYTGKSSCYNCIDGQVAVTEGLVRLCVRRAYQHSKVRTSLQTKCTYCPAGKHEVTASECKDCDAGYVP